MLVIAVMSRKLAVDPLDLDNLCEVVQVDDKGGAVGGGSEGSDEHEEPIEAVSTGEEAGERDGGGRRLDLIGLLHLLLRLDRLPRRLGAGVKVRRR